MNGSGNLFGELPPSSLAGVVYNDLNNDGVQSGAGETGINGVTITLDDTDGQEQLVLELEQRGLAGMQVVEEDIASLSQRVQREHAALPRVGRIGLPVVDPVGRSGHAHSLRAPREGIRAA